MHERSTFELRLAEMFDGYADRAPVDVDAITLAASIARARPRGVLGRSPATRRWLMPVLLGLLLLSLLAALAAGALLLERRPLARLGLVPGADMRVPRVNHTATVLSDGRVLVVGGFTYTVGTTPTAALFNPETGLWVAVEQLAEPRDDHTATLLRDGRVLIAGGEDNTRGTLPAITEVFDPTTLTFHDAGALAVPRVGPTAVALADGRVALIGGYDDVSRYATATHVEIFDPTADTFSVGPEIRRARGASPPAVLLPDDRILMISGTSPGGAVSYDPESGVVEEVELLDESFVGGPLRSIGALLALGDGRVLIALEARLDDWSAVSTVPGSASYGMTATLPGRPAVQPVILADGRVLWVLEDVDDCGRVAAYAMEPQRGSFVEIGELPGLGTCNGGGGLTLTALADGTALVTGGHRAGGPAEPSAVIIAPAER